jgi:excinuclease ABC subunit A
MIQTLRKKPSPAAARPSADGRVAWLTVRGAAENNLKNIDASFPLGRFTCVTGVSGSGKSSLVNDILYAALARKLNAVTTVEVGRYRSIEGLPHLDKVIAIDQSPIGRTPRSNPATYIKLFDEIRDLFAKLPDARLRGYKPGRFSFNVATGLKGGGRCEACEGNGANRIEMDFLADVWVTCPICEGRRFSRETLQIRYGEHRRPGGYSIADVLEMDVQQALEVFENVPRIHAMLRTLHDVGLDYIKLGQSSTTLSGGEAQRIKLARELVKRPTGRTLYVLDEPTTGLHFDDVRKLLAVLHGFVDAGNTVIVIEHNLDVVKTADWIIDLGPEGGEEGGRIVAEGTPEEVAACEASATGRALREVLGQKVRSLRTTSAGLRGKVGADTGEGPRADRRTDDPESRLARSDSITVRGAAQHNLKNIDVEFPRDRMTVCTGVSGSGKTSFAIDTVFTEGYRRYVESLSAYARQFLGQLQKPKVEHIEGLSPAICIEQKSASKSPRSTVGTVTEIYDYLRVLWSRVGTRYCPKCQVPIGAQTAEEIVNRVMALEDGSPILILAPVALGDGETYAGMFKRLKSSGYTRVRIDGEIQLTAEATTLDVRRRHRVEVVVDRTVVRARSRGRINESIEHALALGNGMMTLVVESVERFEERHEGSRDGDPVSARKREGERTPGAVHADTAPAVDHDAISPDSPPTAGSGQRSNASEPAPLRAFVPQRELLFSQKLACAQCGTSYEELGPNHLSFNSQLGWCETCEGLGVQRGAPAAAILRHPHRTLFDGAIAGWPRIEPKSPFGRLLTALCEHLGVSPGAPLAQWTVQQKNALMFGTAGDGAAGRNASGAARPAIDRAGRPPRPSGWVDGSSAFTGVRFHWRGFFPTMDAATRNSWSLRFRLHNIVTDIPCTTCRGGRLRPDAAAIRLSGATIVDICDRPLADAARFFRELKLDAHQRQIAGELLKEIRDRLQFLIDVGLEYLTLHRAAPTLSGGEAQRIRLASQIGSGLSGVLYVLDEPTIGLHPRDNLRLIRALTKLRDLGNTLLVVEHDRDVIRHADRLLDFGPRAGAGGGRIVAEGTAAEMQNAERRTQNGKHGSESLTRAYLSGAIAIPIPSNRRLCETGTPPPALGAPRSMPGVSDSGRFAQHWLVVRGARQNNLKNIDVPIPLGRFVCVTGVSGSGKSSLVNDILWPALSNKLHTSSLPVGEHDAVEFLDTHRGPKAVATATRPGHGGGQIDKVINVDQSPIGTTPSSNPATYTGAFDLIRELFARLPDSKVRGYNANRFSFNRPGGRCDACDGYGQKCIEMHFMPDVWVECEVCRGKRYNPETLEVRFKGKTIADVLEMRVAEALVLFENIPKVRRILQTVADVGLDYVQLGQPAPTLSGGEAQRVKLAAELGKPQTGRTIYILDEPTTGLHFDDVRKLLAVIHRLVDLGNTALVVEHNLDVIKSADWIIDLGPEAGADGGHIVAAGAPEQVVIAKCAMQAESTIGPGESSAERRMQNAEKGLTPKPVSRRQASDIHEGKELRAVPAGRAGGSAFCTLHSAFPSHTAAALAPILAAGPYEERPLYDPAEHARRELEIEKAGLGGVGKEVRMPWQVDGRKWHLAQRTSRDGKPVRWEPAALEFVIDRVQEEGTQAGRHEGAKRLFGPTNWNDRASVEITAPGADTWFLHALTGGEWLLELYFRAPPDTFKAAALNRQLGLKTLDRREDIQAYGDWPRVDVRSRADGMDAVVVYVHDKNEIDTPAFRKFVRAAVRAYATVVSVLR